MADVWNKQTREYIRSVDRALFTGDEWVVIGKGAYLLESLPACDPSLWELVEGEIVEGDPIAPVESMAERHAREQREGVTLANGWVMKWTDEDQNKMNLTKSRADLCEREQVAGPCVQFFEANGTPHMVGYAEAFVVLKDYSDKVMAEQFLQWQEAAGNG